MRFLVRNWGAMLTAVICYSASARAAIAGTVNLRMPIGIMTSAIERTPVVWLTQHREPDMSWFGNTLAYDPPTPVIEPPPPPRPQAILIPLPQPIRLVVAGLGCACLVARVFYRRYAPAAHVGPHQ